MRIGIDLGGTKIAGIVMTDDGHVRVQARVASPRDDYPATLTAVSTLVARLEADAALAPGEARIGIGTPGAWQPRERAMKNCNSTWLNGRPLLPDL
jgi:fructokinase